MSAERSSIDEGKTLLDELARIAAQGCRREASRVQCHPCLVLSVDPREWCVHCVIAASAKELQGTAAALQRLTEENKRMAVLLREWLNPSGVNLPIPETREFLKALASSGVFAANCQPQESEP